MKNLTLPRKCFHLANGFWYCGICKRKASNPKKDHLQVPLDHAANYHTMEKCVSAFVGATQEEKEFDLHYLRILGKCSSAVIDRYSEMVAPLRPGSSPLLGNNGDAAHNIGIDDDDDEPRRVRKRFKPAMFKPEGLTIAKNFRQEDGSDRLFFGRVANIPPFSATNPETRIHAQHWRILYDDGDTEDMDRVQVKAALGLAKKLRENGKVTYDWNARDLLPDDPLVSDSDESALSDEMLMAQAPFEARDGLSLDQAEDLHELVAPNAAQNKLSYLVDYFMMARKRKVVNTFIKDRLATEAVVFGANVPEGIRSIAKQLGARKLQSVVRHKCSECDYAWIGPVNPKDYDMDEKCPDCGNPRYFLTATGIKPVSIFWYFGLSNALGMLHSNPLFKAAYKKNLDLTINAYRTSDDARRLNEATGGEAFKPDNAFYVLYADAFLPNDSATQGVTGNVP